MNNEPIEPAQTPFKPRPTIDPTAKHTLYLLNTKGAHAIEEWLDRTTFNHNPPRLARWMQRAEDLINNSVNPLAAIHLVNWETLSGYPATLKLDHTHFEPTDFFGLHTS